MRRARHRRPELQDQLEPVPAGDGVDGVYDAPDYTGRHVDGRLACPGLRGCGVLYGAPGGGTRRLVACSKA